MNDLKDLLDARLFLLDMDGTLYLGDDVFPGAVDFIHTLADTGRQYIYLTNNSSRAGTDYITRLRRLGFPCESENVFTSGMATGMYLNQRHPGAKVYLAGTKAFYRELVSYGIDLVNDENGHTDAETVDVVVQGFDTELVHVEVTFLKTILEMSVKAPLHIQIKIEFICFLFHVCQLFKQGSVRIEFLLFLCFLSIYSLYAAREEQHEYPFFHK